MKINLSGRVTIVAIGVEDYKFMPLLKGPKTDVENFYNLLVTMPETALYQEKQFKKLLNPTSSEIREFVSNYTFERGALGDILIFYFSGHGTAVGHKDFGFCTIDTRFHPNIQAVLPLTVFKFSELLESLAIVDVTPVVIIDACYSGKAGDALVSSPTIMNSMHEKITTISASNYALLCSCSDLQTSLNSPKKGGLFSRGIFEIAQRGISYQKQASELLGLQQIYRPLATFIESESDDSMPRLYVGDTLLEFPLIKNTKYSPKRYVFTGYFKSIIEAMWNNGSPRELWIRDMDELCGKGAYGNHNKLKLEPWQLVENGMGSTKRKLTEKGNLFAQGKIKIPRSIEQDSTSGRWAPSPKTKEIAITDVKNIKSKTGTISESDV